MMKSSYSSEDVTILLKDITDYVTPLPAREREKRIQSGVHYSEMLPLEYKPSAQYMEAYQNALAHYAGITAEATVILGRKILQRKQKDVVLVSLARAGIPIGILLKRLIQRKYHIPVPHYAISIIRGREIDHNAMKYILQRHRPQDIQFVDGWIGKGAILGQLEESLKEYPEIDGTLGVLSDPAGVTELCGTHQDILIPSSCLNATVTGLISRTFLNSDIIGPDDFHGAAYYGDLEPEDLSNDFLNIIEGHFADYKDIDYKGIDYKDIKEESEEKSTGLCNKGMEIVRRIADQYHITDIHLIKPGIGETTRVLLRRIPWKVLVNGKYAGSSELVHIYQLAKEKNVPVEVGNVDLGNYKTCGIIKRL